MTADEKAWEAAVRPAAVLRAVERRLVAAGAVTELRQLHGLSAQEEAVLVWLELHEPLVVEDVQNNVTRDACNPATHAGESAASAPSSPQADAAMVAA